MSAVSMASASRPTPAARAFTAAATRHAAVQVLAHELARPRRRRCAATPDEAIRSSPNGRIVWRGADIARLERGETALKPRIQLLADEHLGPGERDLVQSRLEAWLAAQFSGKLYHLVVLGEASDLSGLGRGLAYQLMENLGVLRRDSAASEIKASIRAPAPSFANTACASAPSTSTSRRC